MPLDPTLDSNIVTAYLPNPVTNLGHKIKHLAQTVIGGTIRRLFKARPAPPFDGVRPPGDVAPQDNLARANDGHQPQRLAAAKPPAMRSRETWRPAAAAAGPGRECAPDGDTDASGLHL